MARYNLLTLPVPIKKEIRNIDETVETISCKMKFIDSMRFTVNSISNIVDNLTEEIHEIKCKNCGCFPEYKQGCNECYSKNLNE